MTASKSPSPVPSRSPTHESHATRKSAHIDKRSFMLGLHAGLKLDKGRSRAGKQVADSCPDPTIEFYKPRMDILDDPRLTKVYATFELPGLHANEIRIRVSKDLLEVSGNRVRRMPATLQSAICHRSLQEAGALTTPEDFTTIFLSSFTTQEMKFGKYRRIIKLPQGSNPSEISASMLDGLLVIEWPRLPNASVDEGASNVLSNASKAATADGIEEPVT